MKRRITVSIAIFALCLSGLVVAQAGAATKTVSASGGSLSFPATVRNAKTCAWSSSPRIAGFTTTVKCKSGTIARSARFKANTSTTAKSFAVTLIVRGNTTTVHHWKVKQAGQTPPTTTTTTAPHGPGTSFGSGTYVVGTGIVAGTYHALGGSGCYWARLSGFGGTLAETISNDLASGPIIVTIAASDAGFQSSGCGTWSAQGGGSCYWERESGFGGTLSEIIANDLPTGPVIVTIQSSDIGFKSQDCGTWTPQ